MKVAVLRGKPGDEASRRAGEEIARALGPRAGAMRHGHRVNAFLGAAGYGIELVQEGPCSIERRDRHPVARVLALRFTW